MRIGGLDRKIAIEFRSVSQNAYGEAVYAFNTSFTAWAKLDTRTTGAVENIDDGLEKAVQRVVFLIRYSTDVASITSGDRVTYNGQVYDIENVIELGRNTSLRLVCKLVE
jgi:SPP1 family predicted phage head-tail adaptor